jgi:hypothetical protein
MTFWRPSANVSHWLGERLRALSDTFAGSRAFGRRRDHPAQLAETHVAVALCPRLWPREVAYLRSLKIP